MPAGDGTGPGGMGPMTGRVPGYANPVAGRGLRYRLGPAGESDRRFRQEECE